MSGSINEFDENEVNEYSITDLTSNQSIMNMNSSQGTNICNNNSSQNFTTSSQCTVSTFPQFHYDEQLMNLLIEWNLEPLYTTCIGKIENN